VKQKPITPYQRLLTEAREFALEVIRRARWKRTMYCWPVADVDKPIGYRLDTVAHRVQAADQLGYDVMLKWEDRGLVAYYVKRPPDTPWRLQP
jgi:hypothetical protein